ncbi:hypothetical protein A3Q56_02162 [Intoshia linei]|uniref:Protein kinase domain-containing protein n=1 Tax=Intoshia linei TaxID=1819745 RepID=A0A177B8U6_9BILA|nr:hypothetical protein A3Q56_02162 [Intoshia linei]
MSQQNLDNFQANHIYSYNTQIADVKLPTFVKHLQSIPGYFDSDYCEYMEPNRNSFTKDDENTEKIIYFQSMLGIFKTIGSRSVVLDIKEREKYFTAKILSMINMDEIDLNKTISEINHLQQFNHANIISFHSVSIILNSHIVITMNHFESVCLEKVIADKPILTDSIISFFVDQLQKGLVYLHQEMKIVHHDFKSGNVLLGRTSLKIIDFDHSVQLTDHDHYIPVLPSGAYHYMPPEVYLM